MAPLSFSFLLGLILPRFPQWLVGGREGGRGGKKGGGETLLQSASIAGSRSRKRNSSPVENQPMADWRRCSPFSSSQFLSLCQSAPSFPLFFSLSSSCAKSKRLFPSFFSESAKESVGRKERSWLPSVQVSTGEGEGGGSDD